VPAASEPPSATDVTRTAGRGGLAVAFAKIYFIFVGLVQQIALPRLLGLDG
jgi:stage V sporulation protein B